MGLTGLVTILHALMVARKLRGGFLRLMSLAMVPAIGLYTWFWFDAAVTLDPDLDLGRLTWESRAAYFVFLGGVWAQLLRLNEVE